MSPFTHHFDRTVVISLPERGDRLLIIEDDACFHPRAAEWLDMLMPLLPADGRPSAPL